MKLTILRGLRDRQLSALIGRRALIDRLLRDARREFLTASHLHESIALDVVVQADEEKFAGERSGEAGDDGWDCWWGWAGWDQGDGGQSGAGNDGLGVHND